jgi:hypothetical protein
MSQRYAAETCGAFGELLNSWREPIRLGAISVQVNNLREPVFREELSSPRRAVRHQHRRRRIESGDETTALLVDREAEGAHHA